MATLEAGNIWDAILFSYEPKVWDAILVAVDLRIQDLRMIMPENTFCAEQLNILKKVSYDVRKNLNYATNNMGN